ncbi:thiamine pyrophosphate-dependent enzyme [Melioribacteraceae bacterium 4301-Me]|uniref:thiamine pyrophosphate-dependent enzyme n=1 Tax=Pyranulibacter aquaticus TaxID=3163344 RepID=UPI00359A8C95
MKAPVHQTIAYALTDLGIEVITNVPGYGAWGTFQAFNEISQKNNKISFHEELAYSISHAASILGKRSATLIKSQGLMKAANSVTDSLYTSINAGFVTFVFDDATGQHSDNILETSTILEGLQIPFIVPKLQSIYEQVVAAYQLSEKKKMPVVFLIDTAKLQEEIEFKRRDSLKKTFDYKRDVYSHVVHPSLSDYQYKVFLSKKLGTDPVLISRPPLPLVPENLTPALRSTAEKYLPFFEVFKDVKKDFTTGDTSSSSAFALPPFNCIDLVTYMGGSIPLAIGAYLAGCRNVWALTGDFGFISAGHLGLIEALNREIPLKVVIFYNKQAAATGGQVIHKKIIMRILAGYEKYIVHLQNPNNPFEVSEILNEVNNSNELKIVLADYPES